jgi:hypothetical protein
MLIHLRLEVCLRWDPHEARDHLGSAIRDPWRMSITFAYEPLLLQDAGARARLLDLEVYRGKKEKGRKIKGKEKRKK